LASFLRLNTGLSPFFGQSGAFLATNPYRRVKSLPFFVLKRLLALCLSGTGQQTCPCVFAAVHADVGVFFFRGVEAVVADPFAAYFAVVEVEYRFYVGALEGGAVLVRPQEFQRLVVLNLGEAAL
jgi:hypothetical protein